MRLLDRYMSRELVWPFLVGVAAFTAILMGTNLLFQLAKLALSGVPLAKVLRLFFLGLPAFVVLTFPMSMLFSSLMAFGRLSGESEMVAMFASGISLYRMLIPVCIIAALVCGLTWEFNELVVPWASRSAETLKEEVGQVQPRTRVILPQYEPGGDRLIRLALASGYDSKKQALTDVNFMQFSHGQLTFAVTAPTARFTGGKIWEFYDATVWEGEFTHKVKSVRYDIGRAPDEVKSGQPKPEQMTYEELRNYIRHQADDGIRGPLILQNEVELQRKIALPFTSLVFAAVGAPLGIRPSRRSSGFGLGLGFSVLIIFAFYVMTSYLEVLGGQGGLDPVLAAWIPNLVTFGFGVVLLLRAPK
jgi:lipopolysaccharide export system permease protein